MKAERKEEKEKNFLEMVKNGFLPIEEAARELNSTVEEVKTTFKKLFGVDYVNNTNAALEQVRINSEARGIEQGIEQERIRMLVELVSEGTYTIEQAAKKANMPLDKFREILKAKDET